MSILYRKLLFALGVLVSVMLIPEVRLMAQGIDQQTMDTLRLLLDANIIQSTMFILALLGLALLGFALILWRIVSGLNKRVGSDQQLQSRLVTLNESNARTNERVAESHERLINVVEGLSRTSAEDVIMRNQNRESILKQTEATTTLVTNVDMLNRNMVSWSKLIDDGMSAVRSELVRLVNEFLKFREQQDLIVKTMTIEQQALFERVIRDGNILILAKLDEILKRLPTPPGTEPHSALPYVAEKTTDADGAKHHATVDLPVMPEIKDDAA